MKNVRYRMHGGKAARKPTHRRYTRVAIHERREVRELLHSMRELIAQGRQLGVLTLSPSAATSSTRGVSVVQSRLANVCAQVKTFCVDVNEPVQHGLVSKV